MLDTNVFNDVLDGKIDIANLKGLRLKATHIQWDEIGNTKDQGRKDALLSIFEFLTEETTPTTSAVFGISVFGAACPGSSGIVPTESAVWGISRWGAAKWGADNILTGLRQQLDALNKKKRNNVHDILIAETSVRNGWVLITSDSDLFLVVTKYSGACANLYTLQTEFPPLKK